MYSIAVNGQEAMQILSLHWRRAVSCCVVLGHCGLLRRQVYHIGRIENCCRNIWRPSGRLEVRPRSGLRLPIELRCIHVEMPVLPHGAKWCFRTLFCIKATVVVAASEDYRLRTLLWLAAEPQCRWQFLDLVWSAIIKMLLQDEAFLGIGYKWLTEFAPWILRFRCSMRLAARDSRSAVVVWTMSSHVV